MRLPASSKNWVSITGAGIAIFALINIVMLFFVTLLMSQDNPYIGIVLFLVMPGILIFGLLLIPIGMWINRKQERRDAERQWPAVDLNKLQHRNAALIFLVGTVVFVFLSVFGAYEAFHFSESVEFCGTVCHRVMEPEYVAYQNSAHARVACVDCHVGEGAGWYVKSKMSGMYQVYAVTVNNYPQPIPTPIENLRPARETCERCHWPQKFYTRSLRHEVYYLADETNTEWTIDLMMKIGGDHESEGLNRGSHWHVNPNTRVEYAAAEDEPWVIPWVRYTNLATGEVTEFMDEENPVSEEELSEMHIYEMDCMSCHNRPSHNYNPPSRFINAAITAGDISQDIPEVKMLLNDLCSEEYASREEAHSKIREDFMAFYKEDHPDFYREGQEVLVQAADAAIAAFDKNIFPYMKARWDAYPTFIGHMESDGCFRCHNGTHASESGDIIRRDCQLCHSIQAQGSEENWQTAEFGEELEFMHPVDIGGAWEFMLCSECHTGANL